MKPQPPKRGPVNPSDTTVKQGFSLRRSLLEKAKARSKKTHGGNLSLYLSHLIESDTGDASAPTVASLASDVSKLDTRVSALESKATKK